MHVNRLRNLSNIMMENTYIVFNMKTVHQESLNIFNGKILLLSNYELMSLARSATL